MKLMKGCNYAALGKKYFTVIDISINHEGKVIKLFCKTDKCPRNSKRII